MGFHIFCLSRKLQTWHSSSTVLKKLWKSICLMRTEKKCSEFYMVMSCRKTFLANGQCPYWLSFLIFQRELHLPDEVKDSANSLNLELKSYSFNSGAVESSRPARRVRVGLIQNSIVLPTTDPVLAQRDALLTRIGKIIEVAHQSGVNIICMQEAWSES